MTAARQHIDIIALCELPNLSSTMTFLRCILFLTAFAIIAMRDVAYAQDDFGQVLLEAFTTGAFNGESSEQAQPGSLPTQTPAANVFPAVTLQPTLPDVTSEFAIESPEETLEDFVVESPEGSSEETLNGNPEETTEEIVDDPEQSAEESLEPNADDMGPNSAAITTFEDDLLESPAERTEEDCDQFSPEEDGSINGVLKVYKPIRVNCGSFGERNKFSQDTKPWFSHDSVTVEDPFAAAQFSGKYEALLYSTYRYSAHNLTYTVPIPTEGVWRVTLQWAEIVPVFMREGTRVFTVSSISTPYSFRVFP